MPFVTAANGVVRRDEHKKAVLKIGENKKKLIFLNQLFSVIEEAKVCLHEDSSSSSIQDKKFLLALGLFPAIALLLVPCFSFAFRTASATFFLFSSRGISVENDL